MAKSKDPTKWNCGCERTPENSTKGRHPQCRRCKIAYLKRRYLPESRPLPRVAPIEDPVALYRTEKARRAERDQAALVPVAQAFQAQLAREDAQRKGGRPRKNIVVGNVSRPFFARAVDPRDALLEALGPYGGG